MGRVWGGRNCEQVLRHDCCALHPAATLAASTSNLPLNPEPINLKPQPSIPIPQVDATEYLFKLALLQRKYDAVINMIKGSALCGQAIISYLQQQGYPEVRTGAVQGRGTPAAANAAAVAIAAATAREQQQQLGRVGNCAALGKATGHVCP